MRVLYFATAADRTACREEEWETQRSLSLEEFWCEALRRHPKLADICDQCRVASAGRYVSKGETLNMQTEVAVIPPVSGG